MYTYVFKYMYGVFIDLFFLDPVSLCFPLRAPTASPDPDPEQAG